MNEFKQVIQEAELALSKGDYGNCIKLIAPILKDWPVSKKEGVNLRMVLLTALRGLDKREESLNLCRELIKSPNPQVRENCKSLLEILESPTLKTPDNWNISFTSNTENIRSALKAKKPNPNFEKEKKFINTVNSPTGETKPFKKGFIFITMILLIFLISLLSGCVKINNTIDLRNIDSININLEVESKYKTKVPWQINFEKNLNKNFPKSNISKEEVKFSFKKTNLSFEETKDVLDKIILIGSETTKSLIRQPELVLYEKKSIFGKESRFNIMIDLSNLEEINNLELFINIIHKGKINIIKQGNNKINIDKNILHWQIYPSSLNSLEFSYWTWNKSLVGIIFTLLIILSAYLIRDTRYKMDSQFPELPS